MAKPATIQAQPEIACADADIIAEMTRWMAHLRTERRLSPKTTEAYARDLRQFLVFLGAHWGSSVTLKRFAALEASDVRAFMVSILSFQSVRRDQRPPDTFNVVPVT